MLGLAEGVLRGALSRILLIPRLGNSEAKRGFLADAPGEGTQGLKER